MGVQVREVASRKELLQFIKYPVSLYADDACYVPHLLAERKEFFGDGNPVFQFTRVRYLIARDETGRMLGRTTVHVNSRHNEFADERTGFFGFFECVEDLDVARCLMAEAERWLVEQGMDTIRGPFSFSTNHECGFLLRGFDTPPVIMMPYTKRYYPDLMERLGYCPAKDLLAYEYHYPSSAPKYLERFSKRARKRSPVTVRTIGMRNFGEEVRKAFSVYNRAWAENWGFVPMTEAQFAYMARSLKPIVDPDMTLIAEVAGEPVGFLLALPDCNVVLRKMKGRLFPLGAFHWLLGRRAIKRVRVVTMGVVKEYRKRGIDTLLAYHAFQNGSRRGYTWAELSWILEDNVLLRRALSRLGAVPYKTYRIYGKSLCES